MAFFEGENVRTGSGRGRRGRGGYCLVGDGVILSFKKLQLWQNAMESAIIVFELTQRFRDRKVYPLSKGFQHTRTRKANRRGIPCIESTASRSRDFAG